MPKEIESFQDNIRRTFILFSLTPVIGIVFTAIILFILTWSAYLSQSNSRDNQEIVSEINETLSTYYNMISEVEQAMEQHDAGGTTSRTDASTTTDNTVTASGETTDNAVTETATASDDTVSNAATASSKTTSNAAAPDDIFKILYGNTAAYDDIGNLMLITPQGQTIFAAKQPVPAFLTAEDYLDWGIWNRVKRNPGMTTTILYEGTLYVIHGVAESTGSDSIAYAIIYAVPSQVISDIVNSLNRYCIVTDDNGWIYISNIPGLSDEFGQIQSVFEGHSGYVRSGSRKFISTESQPTRGLKVYTFYDVNRSLRMVLILMIIIAIIFCAIIVITYRSTATSSEIYTRDVKKIEDAFEAVQQGDLDVSLNIDSSKEFQTIGNDFNEMLDGLKQQIDRNKELAENAAFSQVKQLESQFNPHFLFNTLDNIRFMAKIDAAAADKMIVSLSGLLRYSIREMREEVTVREDLDNLQYYLNILQIRFNKRFAYDINVSDDIYECLIPKLLLQPLLENAVKYGFGTKEKLTVRIKGYQIKENLIFICEDDGVGIAEETLRDIKAQLENSDNTSAHFGIYNIHRRIRLMYKGDYGLDITSKQGEGTTVRLTLPKHS